MIENGIELKRLIEDLTGQESKMDTHILKEAANFLSSSKGLGGSQFNELLLLMGFDRIEPAFFQYLVNGNAEVEDGASLDSFKQLEEGIKRFQILSLLHYGNVKYGFKQLSESPSLLYEIVKRGKPNPPEKYKIRHQPIHPVERIPGKNTYYLGYIIENELKERLKENPKDLVALEEEKLRKEIVKIGVRNQDAYLASDHLDVYVATSMRKRHEFLMVNDLANKIFNQGELSELNLRWFDPTQAYCGDRIDKGLAEGLMLKRAKCTLYFVQESDTIGKDSELAATLAQGKPVVAFVPKGESKFVDDLLLNLKELYPDLKELDLMLEQLQIFEPQAAWTDQIVQKWLNNRTDAIVEDVRTRLKSSVASHYKKRADTLKTQHPLGIQVCLDSGVANGVLVVHTVQDCAKLIRRILLNELEFRVDIEIKEDIKYLKLTETISECVFRVMTGDVMLTNAFWNFYLKQ